MTAGQKTKWRHAMTDCLTAFVREQSSSSCPVVDYELRTSPTGDPDDMTVWFICRTKPEKEEFGRTERSRSISVFKNKMLTAGFSDSAVASVEIKI
ncbi:MAG: hypothetical protein ABI273_20620, partial [Lacunisphaera sp.]